MRNTRPLLATAAALALALAALAAPLAPAARAQSLNQLGIARLNADAQSLWSQDGLPMARQAAQAQLQKLVGTQYDVTGGSKATVLAINSVTIQAPAAPGLTKVDGTGIAGRLPLAGTWTVGASIRVRWKGKIAWIPFDDTFNVQVTVKNLSATIRADIDSSDPAAPRVSRVYPPQVSFALDVQSANAVVQAVQFLNVTLLTPLANEVAKVGAVFLAQKLGVVVQGVSQVVGLGGPGHAATAPVANLEALVNKIEDQSHATKMPFGTIFAMHYQDDYNGTWEQSLNDPTFPLVPVGYEAIGDSATNTGEWLAGLCMRYATTRSPQTLARIRQAVKAYDTLLHMKGRPGDLNRMIMPVSAMQRPLGPDEYVVSYKGVDYLASDYISRDNYFGVFFGLSHVHDLVGDPLVKADAARLIETAIDYLLANNWTWRKRDGSFGERWHGVLDQQYAWLLVAKRVNPAKYAAVCAQYQGFADILWTGFWIAVLDPVYSYYKFELGGGALYTVLRLENDPVRWQRSYQGFAIMRRSIGHHENALFNCFYLAADPSSKARLGAESRDELTSLLRQTRRKVVISVAGDPSIEHVPYSLPIDPNVLYPSGSQSPSTIEIAKYPIPIEKRITTAAFAWTCSPFRLDPGHPVGPKPYAEGEGTQFTLPYWMARYHGAIRGPAVVVTATAAVRGAAATR